MAGPKKKNTRGAHRTAAAERITQESPDAWSETVDIVSSIIDPRALRKAYRLEGPAGPCKESHANGPCHNPRCIAGQPLPTVARLADKITGPKPDSLEALPDDSTGDDLVPVHRGLRNLGNTCYLNAVLQMVNHIPRLCRHILDAATRNPSGVIASSTLPWLFLQMRFARYACVDPASFVSFLHVDHSIQQDAQEFLALLLQWLQSSLQSDLALGESASAALTEEIEGQQLFVRTCEHCGAEAKKAEPFWFLSVGARTSLIDAISRTCGSDSVEGFMCGKCNQSGTATTTCEIKRLPAALMIHVTRFQYDAKAGARIKLTDNVAFPTVLDMQPYAPNAAPGVSTTYALHGVINHIGSTPTAGHYTYHARLQDDTWCSLDDSSVTKLRKYSGATSTSREAYVLVYLRLEPHVAAHEESAVRPCAPLSFSPPTLEEFPAHLVEALRSRHLELCDAKKSYDERRACVEGSVRHWLTIAEGLAKSSSTLSSTSDAPLYFVSRAWLKQFYSMFTETSAEGDTDTAAFPFDASTFVCSHGKLRMGASYKGVPEATFVEMLSMYGDSNAGATVLDSETGLCSACAIESARLLQDGAAARSRELNMKTLARVADVSVGVVVNADVLDRWLEGPPDRDINAVAEDFAPDLGSNLVCLHGNLNPAVARRCIAVDVFQYLIAEKGFLLSSREFTAASEPCPECLRQTIAETSTRHGNQQRKFAEIKLFPTLSQDLNEVNKAVWKRDIASYTKKHQAAWRAARAKELSEQEKAQEGGLKVINKAEKAASTPAAVGATLDVDAVPPPRRFDYFGVPTDWVMQWRAWSASADHEMPPPKSWSTAQWLCPHRQSNVDEHDAHAATCVERYGAGASPLFWLLKEEEYQALIAAYGDPEGFQLVFSEINDQRKLTPEPCGSCVAARLEEALRQQWKFTDGCITIDGRVRRSKRSYQDVCETFDRVSFDTSLETIAERLSVRILERHGLLVPSSLIRFSSNKLTAVTRNMLDMNSSLEQSRTRNNATLYFVVEELADKVEVHESKARRDIDEETALQQAIIASSESHGRSAEVAFGATRLSGLAPLAAPAATDHISCPVCTFLNPPNRKYCEICESSLA